MSPTIKVLFFAQLREDLNCAQLELPSAGLYTLTDVKAQLLKLHPNWQSALTRSNLLAAVNQEYVKGNTALNAGDEVAFFPPVTGG